MAKQREINFCAEWDAVPQKSWSGTTWGLYEALSKIAEVHSVKLSPASGALRHEYAVRRRIGLRDFDMKKTKFQQKEYDRKYACGSNPFFQFSDVPAVKTGELHYIYQDLSVEWVWRCMQEDPSTFAYSGYSSNTKRATERRLRQQRAFYDNCAGVFTMGSWIAEYLVRVCGLPAHKVHHVGGGINSKVEGISSKTRNTFLFVGRDFKRKGGDLTIEAFKLLHEEDPSLRLVVAGPKQNPAPGIEGVCFVGDVGNEEIGRLMSSADVFVMPSRFEAYGLVFPEAMAAGLPCVGRAKFEMPYFIEDRKNGRLVHGDDVRELRDSMFDCLSNDAIRRNALDQIPDVIKQYSWDEVAKGIMAIIEDGCHDGEYQAC